MEKSQNFWNRHFQIFQPALPDDERRPATFTKETQRTAVSLSVRFDFLPPIAEPALGQPPFPAAVAMPKASVYENRFLQPREHDIGPPRQVRMIGTVAKPKSMQRPPKGHFRSRIPGADTRHDFAANFRRYSVCHFWILRPVRRPSLAIHKNCPVEIFPRPTLSVGVPI